MARTPNICGMSRRVIETEYENYETALTRGPLALAGPCKSAMGLSYDPHDISRCYKLFVRAGWVEGTYWLALKHANGHWSSWPCIIHETTLRALVALWDPKGLLRWAFDGAEPSYDWPRIRHFGAKSFKPRNSVMYPRGPCITLLRRGNAFALSLRSYPHTINGANYIDDTNSLSRLELMSSRPFVNLKSVGEFGTALGPHDKVMPDQWIHFTRDADRRDFLARAAKHFTQWAHLEVRNTTPNRVVLAGKDFDAETDEMERDVAAITARVKKLQAEKDKPTDLSTLGLEAFEPVVVEPPVDEPKSEDDEDEKWSAAAEDAKRSIEDDEDEPSVEEELEKELGDDVEDLG